MVAVAGLTASGTPPPSGVAPVLVPAGGFSIDGDLLANTPASGFGDWLPSTNSGAGGAVLDITGAPLNPATTFHFADAFNSTADNTFVGGLKWTDDPNTWQWTTSKASSKTDINNVLFHVATDTIGHTWIIVAADRLSTSGDSYIDFEFLQNTLLCNSNGTFSSAGPNGGRTTNDVLLSLAFTSGGSVADFFAWRWQDLGGGSFGYVDGTAALPAGRVFVAANSSSVAVPFGAFGQTTYSANAFAEAAIDLTALLGNFDPCLSIGVKTVMVKTKTSQSSTATIADFINPIQYTLKLGPSADAGPDQTRCVEDGSTAFALQGRATPGMHPIASTSWSVVSGNATLDDSSSLTTTAHVFSASATLRLTVIQSNGCTETDDVVLNVSPLPTGSIGGPGSVCPQSTSQFVGPAGMAAYVWSVTGSGLIVGSTNTQVVNVTAGPLCGSGFTLSLSILSNRCSSTCITNVAVNDTNPPALTVPPDLTLECPADTRTNVTGMATATDDCGQLTVSYSDTISNNCGGTRIIARTWTATDQCGNTASAVQFITVRDSTPPSLSLPPNRTLECPADTSTNNTGAATAQDGCGSVLLTSSDMVSNSCAGTKVIARTWTAIDQCGNTTNRTQLITVVDTTPPSLTLPPDRTLECPSDTSTNNTGVATAQDGCGSVMVTYSDLVTNRCAGTKVLARTWTAIDQCGNTTNRTQLITVVDTTPPSLTLPPNRTLECPADTSTNNTGVAVAQDGCGSVLVRYSDRVTNSCAGTKVIARTWTAIDQCGNSTNAVQTITVIDSTPPALSLPPDRTLECPANTSTNNTGVATAQDGCGSVTVTYSDTTTNTCAGTKVIARTWTAVDQCGNTAHAVQTITVVDTTPPTLSLPPNRTLECPADTSTNNTGLATAQDGCGSVTITYSDTLTNSCAGTKVIARTWTAIDQCGNTAHAVQTITVVDTTPPSLSLPPNRTLECPADTSTNKNGVALAQDGCGSVVVRYSDTLSNACGGTKVISRTWTAIDQCGNTTNAVQTLTIVDTTPPTLSLPPDRTLECPADTSTNNTGSATAQDGCGSVVVTYSDSTTNNCAGTKVIARTWTAIDQCGNTAHGVQTITVVDTTPPSLTLPPNRTLECPADTSTNNTGAATARDGCGSVVVTYSDSVTNNCAGTKVIARTWTAVDQCGNTTHAVQTITVVDITPPSLTLPPNLILECPADTSTNSTGVATAQDGCGSVVVSYHDTVTNPCGGTRVIARTWTAIDQCGNTTNRLQTITVRDTTPPTLTVPPDMVLECPADTSTNNTGVALAQDGCSAAVVTYSDTVSNTCGGAKVIARLWSATDSCGNTVRHVQTITVRDTQRPTLLVPLDLTLECGANTATSSTGTAIAQDGCSSVTVSYIDSVTNLCGGSRIISRLWTAVDACGNSTNGLQTITVLDRTPPTIALAYIRPCTYSQGGWSGSGAPGQILQSSYVAVFPNGLTLGIYNPGNGTTAPNGLFWQPNATGLSALQSAFSQNTGSGLITQDALNPTGTYGAGALGRQTLALICNIAFNAAGLTGAPTNQFGSLVYTNTGSDSLSGKTVQQILDAANAALAGLGLPAGYDLSSLTSLINNLNIAFESCTTSSWAALHIVAPSLRVVSCPSQVPAPNPADVTASDACSPPVTVYSLPDVVNDYSCPTHYTLTRTWVAQDACGNTNSISYFIQVLDTNPPSLTLPPNLVLQCPANTSTNYTGVATAQDACGPVSVSFSDIVSNTCGGANVTYRTWSATDGCNTTNRVQLITVQDTTPPSLTIISNRTLAAGQAWSFDEPVATDTCSAVKVSILNTVTNPVSPNSLAVSRTWVAADGCGNSSFCQQTVTITNTTPLVAPAITSGPQCQTVACGTNATLTVTATGSGAFSYQWRLNGTNLAGATGSSLQLSLLQATNAGLYSVVVSNSAGSVTSSVAMVDVAPVLAMQRAGTNLSLTWAAPFILQSATSPIGPYTDVSAATSPYPLSTKAAPHLFFRLRSPAFSLSLVPLSGGRVSLTTPGVPGYNLLVQASTNLVNWVNLATNPSPCVFIDSQAAQYPHRFYRVVLAQTLGAAPRLFAPSIATQPSSQTLDAGSSTSLSASAIGSGPFTYQWRRNGTSLAGATQSTLNLNGVGVPDAGLYTVLVSGPAGSVTSAVAVVNVAPVLATKLKGSLMTLTWPAPFLLQAAAQAVGPYTNVPGATSPYIVDTTLAAFKFYRLVPPPFTLSLTSVTGGQCSLSTPGVPGYCLLIQASTNLVNWQPLSTNASPCSFTDTMAAGYPRRFYRAVLTQ